MQLSEIQAALQGAMIGTRYQPIVRLSDRVPVALEVLARMNHPERGTLLPDRFVPQLEDAGLASKLTAVVARRAFAELAGPRLASYQMDIALNLPLDVLLTPEAPALVDLHHRLQGIPASQVVVELTESRPVEDLQALKVAIIRLREAGYQVVIDDVQATVPQLDALLELPFTGLKFDKQPIQCIVHDPACLRFVARIVKAAKKRGMVVTAEGIEDTPTWDLLVTLGVDRAQGFLIARPMLANAIPGWLQRWGQPPHAGQAPGTREKATQPRR